MAEVKPPAHPWPSGTVAFLFTDIEGSTRRWEADSARMSAVLARHNVLLREAIGDHGGRPFKTIGDAFQAAFHTAPDAVAAAVAAQRSLAAGEWAALGTDPVRVRMAIHVGEARPDHGDYLAPCLNRLARLLGAGYGGQTLLTHVAAELVRDRLPDGATLRELGVHRLRDLLSPEHVVQVDIDGLPVDFPPLKTLDARQVDLPEQPTPLVGREADVAAVQQLLLQPGVRLVTLVGPGGVGKTRLALQAAAESSDAFADGVQFVALEAVHDPAQVLPRVAAALGISDSGPNPLPATLAAALKSRQLLLLLDNFEHIVAAATAVNGLLEAAPGLKVLATSREPLNLRSEHVVPVAPLGVNSPDHQADSRTRPRTPAVELFVQRAKAVLPSFEPSPEQLEAIDRICWLLDGLPLAIELAAARIRLFGPTKLLARLSGDDSGEGSPRTVALDLLTGGARDLPARQQNLRDTIAWSHALLTPTEQTLFRRLAVFWGGWGLEAAEAVCDPARPLGDGSDDSSERPSVDALKAPVAAPPDENASGSTAPADVLPNADVQCFPPLAAPPEELAPGAISPPDVHVLDDLSGLVDHSLVRRLESETGPRFQMLRTIQEFAARALAESGERAAFESRHAAYYLALAVPVGRPGSDQVSGLGLLSGEHENLRAAVRSSLRRRDAATALRLGAALWRFWYLRGYLTEGRLRLAAILALPEAAAPTAIRAEVLNGAGVLAWQQSDYAAARSAYEASLAIRRTLDDPVAVAGSLNNLALVAVDQSDTARGRELLEEAVAISRRSGDRRAVAFTLHSLASLLGEQGDWHTAGTLFEESLALKREIGDQEGAAASLTNLGLVAHELGDPARGKALMREALVIERALGDQVSMSTTLHYLGMWALDESDVATAHPVLTESLDIRRSMGDRRAIADSLRAFARLASTIDRWEDATRLEAAADRLRRAIGAPLARWRRKGAEDHLAAERAQLGDRGFDAAWAEGMALDDEAAMALVKVVAEAATQTKALADGVVREEP